TTITSISFFNSSTIISSNTLQTTYPLQNKNPSPHTPTIPISTSQTSPKPFTTQPNTTTLINT
ncbi:hypothetical protein Q6313_26320, partial [Klebsiella pneumoniae]